VKKAAAKRSAKQSAAPKAVPRGSAVIDVDISSQTMRIYKGGKLYRTVPVSTGSGKRYCEKGVCGTAVTPRGTFRIYNYINGWRTARLGKLYNPLYFKGGYAIHGGRLPGYPASHGCVRVSYGVAEWLPRVAGVGSTVRIHN
jgi:lipoprotein-anchoring transpeptidase ErfK/SrfK